jgi:hypothetical protein
MRLRRDSVRGGWLAAAARPTRWRLLVALVAMVGWLAQVAVALDPAPASHAPAYAAAVADLAALPGVGASVVLCLSADDGAPAQGHSHAGCDCLLCHALGHVADCPHEGAATRVADAAANRLTLPADSSPGPVRGLKRPGRPRGPPALA